MPARPGAASGATGASGRKDAAGAGGVAAGVAATAGATKRATTPAKLRRRRTARPMRNGPSGRMQDPEATRPGTSAIRAAVVVGAAGAAVATGRR
jgi:hypothetical protein